MGSPASPTQTRMTRLPHPLRFDFSRGNGRVTIAISGDLDMAGTLRLQPQLDRLMRDVRPEVLVLDLRGVGSIDCVGLSLGRTAHGVDVRLDRTRHPRRATDIRAGRVRRRATTGRGRRRVRGTRRRGDRGDGHGSRSARGRSRRHLSSGGGPLLPARFDEIIVRNRRGPSLVRPASRASPDPRRGTPTLSSVRALAARRGVPLEPVPSLRSRTVLPCPRSSTREMRPLMVPSAERATWSSWSAELTEIRPRTSRRR